ncbi:MAG: YhbY family RNA-binding protein [Thermoplasmatota archaeon]
MDKKALKVKGMSLKATVQVGKSGLTEAVVKELDEQLEKRELVKVKMMNAMGPSRNWKDDVEKIVGRLGADLLEIKGGTVLLYRKGTKKGVHIHTGEM